MKNFKEILSALRLTPGTGDITETTLDFTKKVVSRFREHFKCSASMTSSGLSISCQGLKTTQVEDLLEKIIQEFVLCSNCNYPELCYKIKDNKVRGKCNACGNKMKDMKM